ncbi:O-antigen translocase [Shimia aestuarii]|uniref:O-antigen translocase n=1 Tax=Shimia aestuarii TaxID=254406 RepID=UPI001FB33C39|nr:O-antigen translocase [Shimia aestuarii]
MLVIGSAQAVNILISIFRMKLLAILLGPSGVGLFNIYNTLLQMMQQAASLGMAQSGVREIAASRGEEETLSLMRRVLFAAHLVQGMLAMLAVWLLRVQISTWLFSDASRATEVGLIGIAILLALLGTAQIAILQGMRRITDLGRVTVFGAFVATLVGLAAVWMQGENGLVWFILVQPLATVVIAQFYTRRLPRTSARHMSLADTWAAWKTMAKLGIAFMLGALATTATVLLVQGRISQELGLDAAGHFGAAWGITMTYVGFLLGAMGADYYPRLVEVIHDRTAAMRLMNIQSQLGLAIGGPVLLLLIGVAPWVITLLYSSEFAPAVTLLQWQSLGNVFKLASWALGFSIAASARSKTFLIVQVNFNVLFLLILWPTLAHSGIIAAGPAFTFAYILHFLVLSILVRRIHGFRWEALSLGLLGLHVVLAVALLALALTAPYVAAVTSVILAAVTGMIGLRVVLIKIGSESRLATRLTSFFARIGWPIRSTA